MTGTKWTNSTLSTKSASKRAYFQILSGIALATTLVLPALGATKPLPIERIGLDKAKQFVIVFGSVPGVFPGVPSVLNLDGPNHRVVVEFTDAVIDKESMPSAQQLAGSIGKELPAIKGLRFYNITNALKPTARIVFDLPQDVKVDPRVVKLEEKSVTISFGDEVQNPGAKKSAAAPVDGTTADSGAPVPSAAPPPAPAPSTSKLSALDSSSVPVSAPEPASAPVPTAAVASAPAPEPASAPVPTAAVASAPAPEPASAPVPTAAVASAPAAEAVAAPIPVVASANTPESSDPPLKSPIPVEAPTERIEAANEAPVPSTPVAQAVKTAVPEETVAVTPTAQSVALSALSDQSAPAPTAQPAQEPIVPGKVRASWDWSDNELKKNEAAKPAGKTADVSQPTSAQVDAAVTASNSGAPTPSESVLASASATSAPAAPTAARAETQKSAVALYNDAVRNHLAGKLTEAISNYKAALVVNPKLEEAHSNLGLIYNQMHNYDAALTEFHKALAINPKDAYSYNGIGAALRAQKDLPGAIRNWQTSIDLDPKLATAHYNLGTAYEIQRDYDKALESYKDAVHNDLHLGDAYYRMGLIMLKQNRTTDAEAQFKEALKISPDAEYCVDAKAKLASLKARSAVSGLNKATQ